MRFFWHYFKSDLKRLMAFRPVKRDPTISDIARQFGGAHRHLKKRR